MNFDLLALARNKKAGADKKAGAARSRSGNPHRGRITTPPMATIPAPVIELKRAYYGENLRDEAVEPHEEEKVRNDA